MDEMYILFGPIIVIAKSDRYNLLNFSFGFRLKNKNNTDL